MSFSAAVAGNFQFFSSLGGGCQKVLRQSAAAAAGEFQFFCLCRRRRLETFWFSAGAAENFPKFFEKIFSFEKFLHRKRKK
jgi:hypothetical protein